MEIRGSAGELVEQTLTITPGEGARGTQVYHGTLEYCQARLAEAQATRPDSSVFLDYTTPPLCKLSVYSPEFPDESSPGVIATTFELHGNQQQKSVFEHPDFTSAAAEEQRAVRRAVDSREEADYALLSTEGRKFFSWAIQDVPWWTAQYAFRVSQVVSSRAVVSVAFANAERLYNTAAVIEEMNPPAELFWSLEAAYASISDTVPPGWTLAWFKQTPTITGVAGRKFTIQHEFVLDRYPLDLYGGALIE